MGCCIDTASSASVPIGSNSPCSSTCSPTLPPAPLSPSSNFAALVISGTSSGVGKTTVTVGIMAAFASRGYIVQPFKVGPDFLDGMHHEAAVRAGQIEYANAHAHAHAHSHCSSKDNDEYNPENIMQEKPKKEKTVYQLQQQHNLSKKKHENRRENNMQENDRQEKCKKEKSKEETAEVETEKKSYQLQQQQSLSKKKDENRFENNMQEKQRKEKCKEDINETERQTETAYQLQQQHHPNKNTYENEQEKHDKKKSKEDTNERERETEITYQLHQQQQPNNNARMQERKCVNLDAWMMGSTSAMIQSFHRHSIGANLA